MTKELSKLNGPQLQALLAYARDHGRDWKSRLSQDWLRAGSAWWGPWEPLQQLRNNFGPQWLDTVPDSIHTKLPACDFELHTERPGVRGETDEMVLGIKVHSYGDPGVRYYPDGSGQPPEGPELEVVWVSDTEGVPVAMCSDGDFELTDDEYDRACDEALERANDEYEAAMEAKYDAMKEDGEL